jgi:hypothetical protein
VAQDKPKENNKYDDIDRHVAEVLNVKKVMQ